MCELTCCARAKNDLRMEFFVSIFIFYVPKNLAPPGWNPETAPLRRGGGKVGRLGVGEGRGGKGRGSKDKGKTKTKSVEKEAN